MQLTSSNAPKSSANWHLYVFDSAPIEVANRSIPSCCVHVHGLKERIFFLPRIRQFSTILTFYPLLSPQYYQAAYYLDHKPLVNLTSRAIASQISGKTTEELREVLGTQNEPPLPASMTNHLRTSFNSTPIIQFAS